MPWSYLSVTKQGTDKEIAHYRVTFQACFWKRGKVRCLSHENDFLVVRAIFVWPWNENARTKQKQQTNGNKAIWLVYRTDTNAPGFWLVKRTLGWKNFMPEELSRNRFDVILQHDWSIEQCLLHIRVFFGGKMTSPCFVPFIHWLIKQITNTYQNHFSRSYENRSMQMKPPYTWKWGSWKPGMDYSLFFSFRLL